MRKLKFLMLFCLFGSMLFSAQKTTKVVKNEYDLNFNPDKYVSKETEISGQKIKYRAYENIVYVKNPERLLGHSHPSRRHSPGNRRRAPETQRQRAEGRRAGGRGMHQCAGR